MAVESKHGCPTNTVPFNTTVGQGNASNPMRNVVFDNVVVEMEGATSGNFPFKRQYQCENIMGASTGGTKPAPACFT